MITATTSIRVRFAETDAMGVVYHANYLPWCEVARLELIESIGLNYRNINEQGYHLPVLEEYLHYKFPAKYDDIVEIKATIKERPCCRIHSARLCRLARDACKASKGNCQKASRRLRRRRGR